jgi:hypothetical protein
VLARFVPIPLELLLNVSGEERTPAKGPTH